jgi:hypothetical protein
VGRRRRLPNDSDSHHAFAVRAALQRVMQGTPGARAEPLQVLMLPDFEWADRIGEFWGNPKTRAFAELLIDCKEDRTLRAVLVGMLREADRSGPGRR